MATVRKDGTNQSPSLGIAAPYNSRSTTFFCADQNNTKRYSWRIDLLEAVAAYANSRLHAITAQVLVLASGKERITSYQVKMRLRCFQDY
ncbi:hypothetical protein L1987_83853 [Smallanthus sonchifolius]|uniref:Uncharacterized protein n=1 Tax=Smallanthus sonchifolius TaxID=185202 RepID=A0ACB8YEA1_9ASTR|nr:hypothetical protein L1987_83853 [Smallanthus sonchifolius]